MDTFDDESDNFTEMILNQADTGNLIWVNGSATNNVSSTTFPASPAPAIPVPPLSAPSWELGKIVQYDDSSDNYSVLVFTVDAKGRYQEKAAQIK